MKKFTAFTLIMFSNLTFSQQNIMISNINSPSEPSIAINPNNTNQMIAGAVLNSYYKSDDAGLTWTRGVLSSTYGVWGDPCIVADNQNNFYFMHLSNTPPPAEWIDRIVCQKTTNFGSTWNNGSFVGLNGTKEQDKEWAVFDNISNNIYMAWTQFDDFGNSDPAQKSIIRFSKSIDYGLTWTNPIKINNTDGDCVDVSNTVEGAVPAIGPAGQVYLSWAGPNGISFKKSTDQGTTWSANETIVTTTTGWDYTIPGLDRANGQPITACDISPSIYNGNIYINFSDQRNGTNDTDIFLSKSTDGGTTWSSPTRVNDDLAGKHQFLTWMTIDQTTGYIYIVFYDRRNYTNNQTDVYLAYSTNGGNSFINTKISTTPFTPTDSVFFGDYTNIAAHNGVIRPIWSRIDSGQLSIWTAIISQYSLSNNEFSENNNSVINYPNPTKGESYFSFKLHQESKISIKIYDESGKEVYNLIDNKNYPMGKHIITMKTDILAKGIYFYTIKSDYFSKTKKMIVE